jgi:shikimate dehydrogenase
MRALGIEGLSVTMPHKTAIAGAVDRLSPTARALGAVNTVVRDGTELVGESTDGAGFLDALRLDHGFDPDGRRCLVLGAGGAARAIVLALASAGAAAIVVVNRTPARAEAAARLAGSRGRVGLVEEVSEADLVVNATPVGMAGGEPGALPGPVDPARLGPGQVVVDLVYHPLRTPLLDAAADRGADAVDGIGMLVHQAGHALRLWTGQKPPLRVMIEAARSALAPAGDRPR